MAAKLTKSGVKLLKRMRELMKESKADSLDYCEVTAIANSRTIKKLKDDGFVRCEPEGADPKKIMFTEAGLEELRILDIHAESDQVVTGAEIMRRREAAAKAKKTKKEKKAAPTLADVAKVMSGSKTATEVLAAVDHLTSDEDKIATMKNVAKVAAGKAPELPSIPFDQLPPDDVVAIDRIDQALGELFILEGDLLLDLEDFVLMFKSAAARLKVAAKHYVEGEAQIELEATVLSIEGVELSLKETLSKLRGKKVSTSLKKIQAKAAEELRECDDCMNSEPSQLQRGEGDRVECIDREECAEYSKHCLTKKESEADLGQWENFKEGAKSVYRARRAPDYQVKKRGDQWAAYYRYEFLGEDEGLKGAKFFVIKHAVANDNIFTPSYCDECACFGRPEEMTQLVDDERLLCEKCHDRLSSQVARIEAKPIAIIGCSKQKRKDAGKIPARERYEASDLFKKRRDYVEQQGLEYYILSAEYGLISPNDMIEDYDKTITGLKKEETYELFLADLEQDILSADIHDRVIELHAGSAYREALQAVGAFADIVTPFNKKLGIGEQKKWYKARIVAAPLAEEQVVEEATEPKKELVSASKTSENDAFMRAMGSFGKTKPEERPLPVAIGPEKDDVEEVDELDLVVKSSAIEDKVAANIEEANNFLEVALGLLDKDDVRVGLLGDIIKELKRL